MNTLLVPHDFSDCSKAAADQAASLAGKLEAKLILLHVRHYEIVRPEVADGDTNFQLLEADRIELQKEIDRLQESFPKLELEMRVTLGTPTNSILDEVRRDDVDMVIMGTHGRRGLSHLVLGSVAEKVVQLSEVPVLVVKAPGEKAESARAPA